MVDTVNNQATLEALPFDLTKNCFQKIVDRRNNNKKATRQTIFFLLLIGLVIGAAFGTGVGFVFLLGAGASVAVAIGLGVFSGGLTVFMALVAWSELWERDSRHSAIIEGQLGFKKIELTTDTVRISSYLRNKDGFETVPFSFTISKDPKDHTESTVFTLDPNPSHSQEDKQRMQVSMQKVGLDIIQSEIKERTDEKNKLEQEKRALDPEIKKYSLSGDSQALKALERRMAPLTTSIARCVEKINGLTTLSQEMTLKFQTEAADQRLNTQNKTVNQYKTEIAKLTRDEQQHPELKDSLARQKVELQSRLDAELAQLPKRPNASQSIDPAASPSNEPPSPSYKK